MGSHLAKSVLAGGHRGGDDLGGGVVVDGPPEKVYAPNITPGAGSVTTSFTTADWVRVIRHGVKNDGTGALIMPSDDYVNVSERDLASLVAYLKQVRPANRAYRAWRFRPWAGSWWSWDNSPSTLRRSTTRRHCPSRPTRTPRRRTERISCR